MQLVPLVHKGFKVRSVLRARPGLPDRLGLTASMAPQVPREQRALEYKELREPLAPPAPLV